MDRSLLARAARSSLLGMLLPLLLGVAAVIWLLTFTRFVINELGWGVLSPLEWIAEVSRAVPDDNQWTGVLFGVMIWLLMSMFLVVVPAVALVVATPRIFRRARRANALRRFDPDAAPDLVFVRPDGSWMASRVAGSPLRVAVFGVLEQLASDTALAAALAGETHVVLLGDRATVPTLISARLDGYLLDRGSRSSAVIVVDRANNHCWLMGRIVPQFVLVADPSGPQDFRSRAAGAASLATGGGIALVWAADAGGWEGSDGGWGDGGSDGGSAGGGDGGGGGGGDGGDGGGGGGGGGGE
ncbi:hypothetical protein HGA13_21545 [Nocardia speluncae]|uniref:Uncharacterized protein n=1 Tax=Nocardia speluncae TaxID=419477 RepID=A0A846XJX9_9NOCA|nr:hypothetical protein [Nocardia speluncae]NKY35635.1 hypothetical protein [Nocardia speluncae]